MFLLGKYHGEKPRDENRERLNYYFFFSHQGLEQGRNKVLWENSSNEGSLPRRVDPRHIAFPAGHSALQLSANKDTAAAEILS